MRAKAAILSGLLLILVAVASACGGGDGTGRTGVPQVDAVVKAVLSGDEQALRAFVRYTPVACSTASAIGVELCRPGEPNGTLVDALPAAQCEGHYIRPDGIDQALGYLLAGKPKLYGVYHGSPSTWLPGDYTAVFSVEGPEPGQVFGMELIIDDGAIASIDFGCGESPELLAQQLQQQPSPTPAPTATAGAGVPQVDAVVQAVLSGDEGALRGFVRYTPVACSANAGIGDEPCRPGEPNGTVVDALQVADCEGYYIRPEGIDHALAYLLAGKPELYGVYRASRAAVSGHNVAIFSVEGPEPGQIFGTELVIDDDGGIVFIDFGCGASPEQLAKYLQQQPSPTPAATPTATTSG